jgi:hypothetical protein
MSEKVYRVNNDLTKIDRRKLPMPDMKEGALSNIELMEPGI